jgi:hypothetical protein
MTEAGIQHIIDVITTPSNETGDDYIRGKGLGLNAKQVLANLNDP